VDGASRVLQLDVVCGNEAIVIFKSDKNPIRVGCVKDMELGVFGEG
jgi:hypothetical protein